MISNLTKVEEWILESMVIEHLTMKAQRDYGELIWSNKVVADRIPPSFTEELRTMKNIDNALIKLVDLGFANSHGSSVNEISCIVNADGVLAFKRSLIPLAEKVKDKKLFNKILENTSGNDQIREELKSLGNELRGQAQSQIIEALLRYLIRSGPETLLYIIELLK